MIDHMNRCLLNHFLYSINALVNGTWGDWSEYGECTKTCGSGEKSRTRQCDSPPPSHGGLDCDGSNAEKTTCNTQACPGKRYKILNILFCRNSKLKGNPQNNVCTKNLILAIHCEWSDWAYGDCSRTCGSGTRSKTRSKTKEEENGGTCPGGATEIEPCKDKECPSN